MSRLREQEPEKGDLSHELRCYSCKIEFRAPIIGVQRFPHGAIALANCPTCHSTSGWRLDVNAEGGESIRDRLLKEDR